MSELYLDDDITDFDEIFVDLNMTMLHSGETHRVFVYGTLMHGMRNHRRMESKNTKLISPISVVRGDCRMLARETGGGYFAPIVVHKEPEQTRTGVIHGEVYEVSDNELMRLDMFEGHPEIYHRKCVEARYFNGTEFENGHVWMYLFVEENLRSDDVDDTLLIYAEPDCAMNDIHYRWLGEEL